jgi:lysophospholipase L1-like esterase
MATYKNCRVTHIVYGILFLFLLLPAKIVFGIEILTMGDSITVGLPYYTEGGGRTNGTYQYEFKKRMNENGVSGNVYNWGVSGEMTTEGVNRISSVLNSRSANYILIMEGVNDVKGGISSNATKTNIAIMIEKSIARGVTPIVGTITPNSRPGGFDDLTRNVFNPAIIDVANSKGVKVADQYAALRPGWTSKPLHYGDDLHPNRAGYAIIGNTWYRTMFTVPEVSTGSAESIGATSAVVNGYVDPNGSSTRAYFQYGISNEYGSISEENNILAQNNGNIQMLLTGLEQFTIYHYRIAATNSGGTVYGEDRTFQTVGTLPWLQILLE